MLAHPFPTYRRLREDGPIVWNASLDGWVLTRYADVVDVLKDARFSAERLSPFLQAQSPTLQRRLEPTARALSRWMLLLDPPDHTRVRGQMNRAFTPRAVEAFRPRVRALVRNLIDRFAASAGFDAISDLAYPLPAIVIAELIGVPPERRDEFKAWSDDIAAFVGTFNTSALIVERAQESVQAMEAYFRGLIAERRRAPRRDLLSVLLAAADQGDALTEAELFANCGFLLFAGHETTTNLIGNGLLALLQNPAELERLRRDPTLVASAVEEFLRFDGPVDRISRIATQEFELHGQRIKEGDRIICLTSAANRDPSQFPDPDRLDVGRAENRHLAFGLGSHFCIGAPLARVEAQEAFSELVERFPLLELEPQELRWQDTVGFRGLRSLRVRIRPGPTT